MKLARKKLFYCNWLMVCVALQKNREKFSDNLRKKEGRLSDKINRLNVLAF